MIQHLREKFDHFYYFGAWIAMGILSVSFKRHPWHGRPPAFETFYAQNKDDTMRLLFVCLGTVAFIWIIIFFAAMLFFI